MSRRCSRQASNGNCERLRRSRPIRLMCDDGSLIAIGKDESEELYIDGRILIQIHDTSPMRKSLALYCYWNDLDFRECPADTQEHYANGITYSWFLIRGPRHNLKSLAALRDVPLPDSGKRSCPSLKILRVQDALGQVVPRGNSTLARDRDESSRCVKRPVFAGMKIPGSATITFQLLQETNLLLRQLRGEKFKLVSRKTADGPKLSAVPLDWQEPDEDDLKPAEFSPQVQAPAKPTTFLAGNGLEPRTDSRYYLEPGRLYVANGNGNHRGVITIG